MAFPSMTRRPRPDFFGVKLSSSSSASTASPEMISPGPKDNREAVGFFFFINELDRPMVGLFGMAGPWSPPLPSCESSSNTMLSRKADFLNDFRFILEVDEVTVSVSQLYTISGA